jgi:hypothetical protein
MSGAGTRLSRILSDSALRNTQQVTPDSPRFLSDPVAGFRDASAVIAEGFDPLPVRYNYNNNK